MKLKTLLTTLAAAVGLTTAATAGTTTKTWVKFCEEQTYIASGSAGITQYDQNQSAFIFKVNVAANSVNAATQILRYGASNSNYVYLKTTEEGKYRIEIWRDGQSVNLTQDSTVDVTEGEHVFALKVRRGDKTTGQLLSTILYMDGSEIAKIVYGQDGRDGSLKFVGNPMSTMEIGQSGKSNLITMYRINAVESSVTSYAADTTDMQTYVADAAILLPAITTHTATIAENSNFSALTWTPAKPEGGFTETDALVINNTAAAKLTIDEDITVNKFSVKNESGNALTLGLTGRTITAIYNQTDAAGGVTIDASGVTGTDIAKYAVNGAPYSYWYIKGLGTLPSDPTAVPTMPTGYSVAAQKFTGTGMRLLVTAPANAMFGSVNINIAGGRNSSSDDNAKVASLTTTLGGYPVVGTSWNDVESKAYTATATKYIATDGTVKADGNISVKISNFNNSYTTGVNANKNMLTYGYIDDGKNPIVEIGNIPFAKYRVILYRATDTDSTTFSAAQIGTTSSDTKIYYGPNKSSETVGNTLVGTTETDWGKSDWRTGYAEGVNYIVSDVLEGTAGEATAYIYSHKHAGRAGVAAIQIVEVGDYVKTYTATVTESAKWSELEWSPSAPPSGAFVKLINNGADGETTVTLDSAVTVDKLIVESVAGKVLRFSHISNLTASSYDFSAAQGGIGFSVTGGWTVPELLRNYIRDNETKVIFDSDDDKGATLTYSNSGSGTFKSHFVFDGGTHSMTYCGALNNATADNPSILVKDGTTLDFYGHDMGGWTGSANIDGIIAVADGGRINLRNTNGTFYYHQRFTLNPGGDMYLTGDAQQIRFQGGCTEGKELFYVPDSTTAGDPAVIHATDASKDTIGLWNDSTIGIGIYVGNNSALEIENAIKTQNGGKTYEIKKWGAGKLTLKGSLAEFTGTGNGKGKLSMMAGDLTLACGGAIPMTLWASSSTTVEIAGDVDTTFFGPISGAGGMKKTGSGAATLSGANTYTGTTTVEAGTLKVTGSLGTGNYTVAGGATLDLGTHRPSTAKLATSAGAVCVTLTADEQTKFDSMEQFEILDTVADATLGALRVFDADGNEHASTFEVADGKVKVTKLDEKTQPFNVTAAGETAWTAAGWTDSSDPVKNVISSDWDLKVGANLEVAADTSATLTLDRAIQLGHFNVTNDGTLAIAATGDNTLAIESLSIKNVGTLTMGDDAVSASAIDDSESTGTTTLNFAPGSANITAGANTTVKGGGTGALTIGADKNVTIKDALWAGTVTATATSTLKYAGTTTLSSVPYTGANSFAGTVVYAAPFSDAGEYGFQFAGAMTRKFDKGFSVSADRFVTGNNANITQNFTQDGGSITVTGTTQAGENTSSCLMGHWNSTVNYALKGGSLTVENVAMQFGLDGKIYMTVGGGDETATLRAKGIWQKSRASASTLTLKDNGVIEIGSDGLQFTKDNPSLTLEGGTIKAYADTSIYVAHTDGMKVTGPITIDANGFAVTVSSKVTGSGNITVIDSSEGKTGTIAFTGDLSGYTGTIEIADGISAVGFDTARPTATFKFDGEIAVKYTENIADDGVVHILTLAEGSQSPTYRVFDADGNEKTVTAGKYAVTVTGKAALFAWEFNGTLKSNGRNEATMGQDHGPFYNDDNTGVYSYSQPYSSFTWPDEFTVAIACTLPTNANVCLVGWGQATPGGIALVAGDVTKNEVKMVYWQNNAAYTELTKMTVPNAYDCEHLYLVTKTDEGVKVYLDGSLVVNYSGKLSLGLGVQVGTVFQGVGDTGLVRLDNVYSGTNDCKSVVNTMRIYDTVLGPNAMAALKAEFPYESPNGTYGRELVGTENTWVAEGAWTKQGETFAAPGEGSTVDLSADGESSVAVNLDAPANYEAMNFSGEGTITIAAADDNVNKISCSGAAKFGANAVVDYSAVDFAGTPIQILTGKTLTIDASMIDLSKYFQNTTITLTGLVTADDVKDQLACTLPTAGSGRTVAFAKNESNNTYELRITVEAHPFIYTIAGWSWNGLAIDGDTVSNNTDIAITVQSGTLEWGLDRASFTVEGGTLKATKAPTAACAIKVEKDATFDLNGKGDTHYAITLNGGEFANTGDATFVTGFTVTANSSVNATGKISIQSSAGGWNPTTVELGTNTLTKKGDGELCFVATTINGAGTLDIQAGKVYSSESLTFTDGTIKIASGVTYQQRGGRTTTVAKIIGVSGALLQVNDPTDGEGTISAFTLKGTLTLVGGGNFGTITLDNGAVLNVGNKRGLTLAGAGTVNVALTDDEKATKRGTAVPLFTLAEGATTTLGVVKDSAGNTVDEDTYTFKNGALTFKKHPTMLFMK